MTPPVLRIDRRGFLGALAACAVAPFVPTAAPLRAVDRETGIAIRFVRQFDVVRHVNVHRVVVNWDSATTLGPDETPWRRITPPTYAVREDMGRPGFPMRASLSSSSDPAGQLHP